jgi:plasmid maintenance system killer protein
MNYRTKKPGLGKQVMKEPFCFYNYDTKVSTIFPEKDKMMEVSTTIMENYNNGKNFETEKVKFDIGERMDGLVLKSSGLDYPNTLNTAVNMILDQLLISPKHRMVYVMLLDKLKLEIKEFTEEQVKSILDNVSNNKQIQVADYLTKDERDRRINKIMKVINDEIDTIADSTRKELMRFIEPKNRYDIEDDLDKIELKNYDERDGIISTTYTIKSKYWKRMERVLINYDPVELVLCFAMLKQGRILIELNSPYKKKFSLNYNELVALLRNIYSLKNIDEFRICLPLEYRKQPLFNVIC